jgi:hypothetical protein
LLQNREQSPIDGFRFSVVAQLLQDLGVLNQHSVEPPQFVFSFIQRARPLAIRGSQLAPEAASVHRIVRVRRRKPVLQLRVGTAMQLGLA